MSISPISSISFNQNYRFLGVTAPTLNAVNPTFRAANPQRVVNNAVHRRMRVSNTSAGAPLKRLLNITDPYFGVKLIDAAHLKRIERNIDRLFDSKKILKYLKGCRINNMQLVERNIYDRFVEELKVNPNATFPEMLQKWYPEAITKLKLEEFAVLDEINQLSMKLNPETLLAIREQTTKCGQMILRNEPGYQFKRKNLLDAIDRIRPQPGEEVALAELKKCANKLPTSNTSENAFIVKYANRGQQEIAKRLVRASAMSIEHLHPQSLGGENALSNFMLASSSANSLRGNMPLKDFIKQYPQIIPNCQKYINDIIDVINKGGLEGFETYPYEVARTLELESEGLIKLDLSNLKYNFELLRRM